MKELPSDIDAQIQALVEPMRPAEHIREKLDIGYSFEKNSLELFEIRPDWKDPKIIRHHSFVKVKWIKSRGVWQLYWLRASGKWEGYKPYPEAEDIEEVFKVIKEDKHHCFFG